MCFPVDISPKIDLHTEKYLKKLDGWKDVEDAPQRLDKLTLEETRMVAVEALKITRDIDDKVTDLDDKVEGVDDRVKGIDNRVGSVIKGNINICFRRLRLCPESFTRLDVKETGAAVQRVENQVSDLNRSSSPTFVAIDHESLNFLTGNE